MDNVFEIENLQVAYGKDEVIKGITMAFRRGAVTAIIGPSGCGKTTLLRCLNRLTDLAAACRRSGSVKLDGEDIYGMDPILLRRRVGMVFQKPNPFPMSIRENVLYGVHAQGKHGRGLNDVVEQSLRKAALWDEVKDRMNHSATTLSGGQQQRLCIARCLAVSPEVILMDEPAASLDPYSTAKLEESILAMKGSVTVVIVTHDVPEARRVSDFAGFLYDGHLVEMAETDRIFSNAEKEMTRDYVAGRLVTTTGV